MQAPGFLVPFTLALLFACSAAPAHETPDASATRVVDLRSLPDLNAIIPELADRRVVFVGETHDRYSHHLNQLAVIRGLQQRHPDLVIALEFFQQPFQRHLDDYVAGNISEKDMLRLTEYFSRWQFDYRLYRPILRYAREAGLKLLALNIPAELTRKVGREGLEGLDAEERAKLPRSGRPGRHTATGSSRCMSSTPRAAGHSSTSWRPSCSGMRPWPSAPRSSCAGTRGGPWSCWPDPAMSPLAPVFPPA